MGFTVKLNEYKAIIDENLDVLTFTLHDTSHGVLEASRYSLLGEGKRLRPALMMEFYRLCGGDPKLAAGFACGLEMIHAYSLIHDDLPCMDDDDMRRGRPSCHKAFGEATALLAGDYLLNRAFEVMLGAQGLPAESILRATAYVGAQSGIIGMIGGQAMDLAMEKQESVSRELHAQMVSKKTAALIRAACGGGCLLAGAEQSLVMAAQGFATNFGIAFQIIDDILDVVGDEKSLGKPIGSDEKAGKTTYTTLYGLEGSRQMAAEHLAKARESLEAFDDRSFLLQLCDWAEKRTN